MQMNQGAERAGGELLCFLHADCVPPDHFAYHVRKLAAYPAYSVGCFQLAFEPSRPALRGIAAWANLRTRWLGLPYGDQGLFCTREGFHATGGYRKRYLMEDVDFVRKCRRRGRLLIIPDSIRASSRRYISRGVLRGSLENHLLMLRYCLGADDRALYRIYYGEVPETSAGPGKRSTLPS